MKKLILSLAIITLSLTLTGCDKSANHTIQQLKNKLSSVTNSAHQTINNLQNNNSSVTPKAPGIQVNSDAQWNKKVYDYVSINNAAIAFTNNASNNNFLAKMAAEKAAKVAKGDFKSIRSDYYIFGERFKENLQNVIAEEGKTPELDKAAKTLLDAASKYLPNWIDLLEYNKSKKYMDDNGAKGKQMLPMYREGIAKIKSALNDFSAQVKIAAKQLHNKLIAKYKIEGKWLEMYTLAAFGNAQNIIETFHNQRDFKNKSKIAYADAQLAQMEANVINMESENKKGLAKTPKNSQYRDRYQALRSKLDSFAGKYRESRKSPDEFNQAIEYYNYAVEYLK